MINDNNNNNNNNNNKMMMLVMVMVMMKNLAFMNQIVGKIKISLGSRTLSLLSVYGLLCIVSSSFV